jgi:hypothetical protein
MPGLTEKRELKVANIGSRFTAHNFTTRLRIGLLTSLEEGQWTLKEFLKIS